MEDTHARFTNETKGQDVGYLPPNGERRFVPWLGFITREAARALRQARPVRFIDISRIGQESALSVSWIDLPDDRYVHAVFEASVATVAAPESTSPTP